MTPPDVQLGLMLDLEPNWDGYGADRIDPQVVEVAQEFVRLLVAVRGSERVEVTPARDGGVGVAWEDANTRFDLDVNPDGSMELLRVTKGTNRKHSERYTQREFATLAGVFGSVRRLVAA
jgi:hypothetical protein